MDPRFEMRTVVEGVAFDQVSGLGNVPNNQDVGYLGAAVMMRPSVFLSLVDPLHQPRRSSLDHAKACVGGLRPLASPMLNVEIDRNDPAAAPEVVGHEGRHRMLAILETVGDVEVPVHVLPRGMRARHLDDAVVERLRDGMMHETRWERVDGPLFGDALVDGRLVPAPEPPMGRAP